MTLAFVPYTEILRWAAQGWEIVSDLGHHSEYSVLMRLR